MADIEAAAAVATGAPPACWSPAARSATLSLSRFLSLASHVAVCLLLSASWTCSLGNGARIAAGSPQAAVVEELFYMTIYALCLFAAVAFVLAVALFLHCFVMAQLLRRRWRREGREIAGNSIATIILAVRGHGREEAGDHEDDGPGDEACDDLVFVVLALLTFIVPARVLIDAGFVLASLTYCYILFPSFVTMVIEDWDDVQENTALLASLCLDG